MADKARKGIFSSPNKVTHDDDPLGEGTSIDRMR